MGNGERSRHVPRAEGSRPGDGQQSGGDRGIYADHHAGLSVTGWVSRPAPSVEEAQKMTEQTNKLEIDPNRQIRANKIDITPEDASTLMDAVSRALKAKKPAKEDLKIIKRYL